MKKVLAIVGPTAVGKTSLSIELAKKWNGEIISGDSMQVYQKLNIGTAKVTYDEMDGIKHHLIDVRSVQERFSASDFKASAMQLIKEITARNKLPIVVGGTGFYLQALFENLELGGDTENTVQMKKIRDNLKKQNNQALLNTLARIDKKTFDMIDKNNRRRIVRAIEVYQLTGKRISDQENHNQPYDSLLVGLNTDRAELYQRINQRVITMINDGLEQEAKWLFNQKNVPQANNGIGYKEWREYFSDQRSLDSTIELIQKNSRHYAKRQLTWFRNKMKVDWFDIVEKTDEKVKINQRIEGWLQDKNELER